MASTASRWTIPTRPLPSSGDVTDVRIEIAKPEAAAPERPAAGMLELPRYELGTEVATRKAYGDALAALGAARPDVVVLDGEVSNSTFAETFAKAHPERYFEMYIAEQQLVAAAVGLQAVGWRPFASTFAAFLSRAYDFVRMAAISRATFSLCGSHAGVSIGEDGPSQMALEDIASLRAVHGSTVLHPCDANQTAKLVAAMADTDGISYLRTLRPATPVLYSPDEEFKIGGSRVLRSSDNDDVALIGAGITVHEALKAADVLAEDGINARVIDLYSIKPLDEETLRPRRRCDGRPARHSRGSLGRKAASETPSLRHSPRRTIHRASSSSPCARCRSRRSRRSCLAWAGIDAEHIAGRSRRAEARTRCRPCRDRPSRRLARSTSHYPSAVMAVLIASELRKEFAGDPLFENVSFTVGRKDRLSLAGANGAGKTTLLRAIIGETSIQGGKLAFAKGTRVALHDQRPPLEFDITLRDYALSGARDLLDVEDELRRLETAMTEGRTTTRLSAATPRRRRGSSTREAGPGAIAQRPLCAGLGFVEDDLDRPLGTFSGGELTRASLARALAGSPDLLLLDEPTNHLDVQNLEWLERELETIDAAVILVAHDRWFLEAVTTSVLELSPGGAHYFSGPWHEWRQEKAARAAAAGKTAGRVSVDIARLERFVERFRYKKSKAKQAQAKLTQIARLEKERSAAQQELRVADEEAALARVRVPRPAAERPNRPRSRGRRAVRR